MTTVRSNIIETSRKLILIFVVCLSPVSVLAQTGDRLLDMEIRSRQRDMGQVKAGIEERKWAANARREEAQEKLYTNLSLLIVFISSGSLGIYWLTNKNKGKDNILSKKGIDDSKYNE